MVTVGATFQDGPRERQDAVTLATSSLLERQVLPRCPGNSRVLRFTGKRWLIHWDLSLWITVVFRNCLSAPLCIFFFFFFCLCLCLSYFALVLSAVCHLVHPTGTRAWKGSAEETGGLWGDPARPQAGLLVRPHSSQL